MQTRLAGCSGGVERGDEFVDAAVEEHEGRDHEPLIEPVESCDCGVGDDGWPPVSMESRIRVALGWVVRSECMLAAGASRRRLSSREARARCIRRCGRRRLYNRPGEATIAGVRSDLTTCAAGSWCGSLLRTAAGAIVAGAVLPVRLGDFSPFGGGGEWCVWFVVLVLVLVVLEVLVVVEEVATRFDGLAVFLPEVLVALDQAIEQSTGSGPAQV